MTQYSIEPVSVEYLQQSGATAFKITDRSGHKYAFRIHLPVSEYLRGILLEPAVVRSEMVWVSHLFHEAGMLVQEPVRTRSGDWIATATVGAIEGVPCTLHRWVDGESSEGPWTKEKMSQAARLLAWLHQCGDSWTPPEGFIRPQYDRSHILRALCHGRALAESGVVRPQDFEQLERATLQILDSLDFVSSAPGNQWGLLHGDFTPSNLVFGDHGVSAIDFSECGYGHYCYDFGPLALRAGPFRLLFLEEYGKVRTLPADMERRVEEYIILHFLFWFAFLSGIPERHEKAARNAPWIAGRFCRRYLEGRPFLEEEDTFVPRMGTALKSEEDLDSRSSWKDSRVSRERPSDPVV